MKLSNTAYDILKWIAMPCLPALTTLILALGKIWGWELAPAVGATVAAVDTFLCAVLQISTANYNRELTSQEDFNDMTAQEAFLEEESEAEEAEVE